MNLAAIKGDDFPYESMIPARENSEVVITYPDDMCPSQVLFVTRYLVNEKEPLSSPLYITCPREHRGDKLHIPSGKHSHNDGFNHHFEWVNQLF